MQVSSFVIQVFLPSRLFLSKTHFNFIINFSAINDHKEQYKGYSFHNAKCIKKAQKLKKSHLLFSSHQWEQYLASYRLCPVNIKAPVIFM